MPAPMRPPPMTTNSLICALRRAEPQSPLLATWFINAILSENIYIYFYKFFSSNKDDFTASKEVTEVESITEFSAVDPDPLAGSGSVSVSWNGTMAPEQIKVAKKIYQKYKNIILF